MVELLPIHSHIYSAIDAGLSSPLLQKYVSSLKTLNKVILSLIPYQTHRNLGQNIHHLINLHGRVAYSPLPYIFSNWCRSFFTIRPNKYSVPQISTQRNSFINILSKTQRVTSKLPSPDQFIGRVASYTLTYIISIWCRSFIPIRPNKYSVLQTSTQRNSFINIFWNTQMPMSKHSSPDQFT